MEVEEPQLGLQSKVSIRCGSDIDSNALEETGSSPYFSELRSMEERQNMLNLRSLLRYGS